MVPLGITMGEPAGIGPEIIAKAWHARRTGALPPFLVLGRPEAIAAHDPGIPMRLIGHPGEAVACFQDALPVLSVGEPAPVVIGAPTVATAAAVIAALDEAVTLAREGTVAAIVTAPIQKSVLMASGFGAPGHTEYLADRLGRPRSDAVMMLASEELRVVPLTVHVPLAEVASRIEMATVLHKSKIVLASLAQQFGIARPRLAIAGLNPHAGEEGRLGDEEIRILAPAIARLRAEGHAVSGPHAADTLFHAEARARYDAVLCMYHDQALIPLKTLAFDHGVNVTLGLPVIRTSPDHGTALDIAGRGIARPDSMIAAIRLAARLAFGERAS